MSYAYAAPVDFFDDPKVLNAATSNIPGSASSPLQVVASLAHDVHEIRVPFDEIGAPIGVYVGPSGVAELYYVWGGGIGTPAPLKAFIPAGSRVSLRSMRTDAITAREIMMLFIGRY